MANDRILVSTAEMEAAITKYENARTVLQDAYSKMDAAKGHLDNCYKGPAYLALSAKYADIYLNVKSAERAIDESVKGLRNTIATMQEADTTVTDTYTALDQGSGAPTYLS